MYNKRIIIIVTLSGIKYLILMTCLVIQVIICYDLIDLI